MSQGGSGVTAVPGMARTRSGSRSSVLPSSSVAATATGTGTGPTSPWRASGSPSPTAGLGISSPLYMAARTSPIGPPPREALPSLPNGQGQGQGASARYGDNEEEHRDSSAHARGGAASGMHAMANSRPVTAVWESASGSGNGPSPPAATTVSLSTATASRGDGSAFAWVPSAQTGSYAGNGAGDGHRQSPSAARRTMGSSPPTAAAYTRSSTYGPRTAAPQQQLPSIPFASTSSSSPPRASEGHPSSRTGRSSNGASGLATNANSTSPPAPAFARHLSADREVPRHNGYSTPRHTAAETHAQTLSNQASVSSLASTAASYYTPNTSATDITAKSAGDGKDEAAQPLPSKSVLTIALQKAQSAVLLDSAQNEEAAVAAYTQSVRLLRDVMTRVEETAGLWRVKELEKLNALKQKRKDRRRKERLLSGLEEPTLHGANGYDSRQESEDDETAEERREREKREAKLEKREKMRLDESRRLKVIHDTYEERIRVLSADIAERLRIDTLSSDAAEKANQTAASLHASRVSEKQQRHLPEPATSDAVYMTPSRPSTSSERSQDSARAEIGSAMLFNTPISPVAGSAARSAAAAGVQVSALPFPDSPTQSAKRRSQDYHAQTLAKPYQVGPMHADALSQAGRPISATFADMPSFKSDPEIAARQEKRRSRQRTAAETAGVEQSSISFSPDSQSSQFDIVDGQARHSAQFAEGLPDSPNSSSFRSAQHRKKPSTASSARSFNKSPPTSNLPHFAATASQQRDAEEDAEEELYQEAHDGSSEAYDDQPSELATPTPDTQATFASRSRKASSASSNGAHSASNAAAARSRAGSQASATTAHSSLARMTSSESLSSTTSSAFSHGNWPTAATQKVPLPPLPAISSASSSSQRSSVLQPMTRPARSASLAAPAAAKAAQHAYTGPAMDRRPSADKPASSASLLVNPSTSQGTISQRRKSPQVQDAAVMPGYDNSAIKSAPPLQRRGSASRQQHQQKQQPESADDTRRRSIIDGTAFNAAGSLPMRLRALSQPGSKRPNLQSYNSEYAQLPAVPPLPFAPQMVRADSDPTAANQSQENGLPPLTPASTSSSGTEVSSPPHQHAYRSGGTGRDSGELVSPVSSTYTMYLQQQHQSSERQAGRSQHMPTPSITSQSFLEPDTPATASFHSSASLLSSGTSHAGHSVTAYTSQASASLTPSLSEYHPPPADALRRPYHFLRQLRSSILTGAYLTQRLYVPKQLWQQGSVKLIHIETKVRMLDLLLSGLEGIERLGDLLLLDTHANIRPGNASSRVDSANRLAKELESFEGMLDGVQSTLSKKLGYIEAPGGKKGGQSSFGAWSSKLSRSMVTMTKGKNLDAPETYVAALARLCLHSQILDRHIQSLHHASAPPASSLPMSRAGTSQSTLHPRTSGASSSPPKSSDASPSAGQSGYADLSPEMRSHVEGRLRRTSEFFEKTLCRMILVDLGIWLEKYSKKGAGWAVDT